MKKIWKGKKANLANRNSDRHFVEKMEQRLLMSAATINAYPTSITEIYSATAGKQSVDTGSTITSIAGSTGNLNTTSNTSSGSPKATVYQEYQVYEFDAGNAVFPAPGTVNSISGLTFNITDTGEGAANTKYAPSAGGFNVYLIPNSLTQTPDSTLVFNTDTTGLVGQGGVDSTELLGTIDFTTPPTSAATLTFSESSLTNAGYTNLENDLNNNTAFRIAITPNTPTTAADTLIGVENGPQAPQLQLQVDQNPGEKFNFAANNYTVNENAATGKAYVSVSRTGNLNDTAYVDYATGGGTATAGTNYTPTSGTLTFAPNTAIQTFTVPVANVGSIGGNQTFNVTLSADSQNPSYSTGSVSQATETIIDTSLLTNTLTGPTNTVTDIEPSGSYNSSYAPLVGDANTHAGTPNSVDYWGSEVLEFTSSSAPSLYPGLGQTIGAVSNLTLQLSNSATSGNYAGRSGNFNVYLIPNSETTSPTSKLKYLFQDPTGVNGQAGVAATDLLGTFSFDNSNAGYDSYSSTGLNSTVASVLQSTLNTGAPLRLWVTPNDTGTGAIAADLYGQNANGTPKLSISAAVTQVNQAEMLGFTSPSYTISEAGGSETVNLTRSGDLADQAYVNYATSDGTALAGTNYTTASGTATFAANSATSSFVVNVADVQSQGGNKTLNLTLSSPSTQGPGTTAALSSQSTATLTITDANNNANNTQTLSEFSTDDADIESGGPYSNTEFKAAGTSSTDYSSYSAADFNDPNGSDFLGNSATFTPTQAVTAINGISLTIYTSSTPGTSGPIDVYLVPDSTSNIDPTKTVNGVVVKSPHFFNTAITPEGLDTTSPDDPTYPGTKNSFGTPLLLGTVNWNAQANSTASTQLSFPLNSYSLSTEQALITDLNSTLKGGTADKFRVVITPENSTATAQWQGYTSAVVNGASINVSPALSFNVTEQSATPPTIVSTQVGSGSAQRSSLKSLSVTFNEPVSLATGSFTMYQEALTTSNGVSTVNTSGTPTDVSSDFTTTLSNSNQTVTFTLVPGSALDRTAAADIGLLTNGIYQLVLNGSALTDSTGSAHFDSSGSVPVSFANAVSGDNGTSNYFGVLFGDSNGDGVVNNTDNRAFGRDYGASTGAANYDITFDYNGDGTINNTDNRAFGRDYGLTDSY